MTANSSLHANRFTIAYRDMDDVKRYLDAHIELDAMQKNLGDSRYFDHCEATLIAAIIAYCRCFLRSQTEGNASRLLSKSDFDCLKANSAFSELHDLVINKRHTAIAHSDWIEHNTQLLEVKGTSVLRRVSVPRLTHGIDPSELMHLSIAVRTEAIARSHALDTGARIN